MTKIVYVPQEPRYKDKQTGEWKTINLLPALDFGSLTVLFENDRQMSILNAAQMIRSIRGKLLTFDDSDYILCAGDPALIGACCMVASTLNQGRVMLLKWDRHTKRYFPVPINLKEMT